MASNAASAPIGALPEWDLSDLYPAPDSAELAADITRAGADAKAFRAAYEGKLAGLSGDGLAEALASYERLQDLLGRIMSYGQLVHSRAMSDETIGRFYQTMQEQVTEITSDLIFFTLELNRIEEADMAAKLAAPALARYAPWIADTRAFRPHQLSDEVERLLHDKSVAGRSAWVRLYDETTAALRFPLGDEKLTMAEVLHRMSDRDGAVRQAAAMSLGQVLGDNARLFALVTNTLAKDKEIEDRWRGFPRPISARNLSNFVEDEVVDALLAAARESYPRLTHRYYALKAKWFGVEKLDHWDRNAPLPGDDDRVIPWAEARDTVLGAYAHFSPELAAIGRRFFDAAWIDAPVKPGKASGAFAHPTVPSAHPYLLLNYQGKTRDVMTLAHELGHGVHQILAAGQGPLLADTPLTLAETASVFGEMLTFRAMLRAETDPARRKIMLATKVEDMLNTAIRQVAMCEFERRLHDRRREGELTAKEIGLLWRETQTESLGPAIRLGQGYEWYWAYIPHFIHTPFYVYAYAFGDCLVNSLYSVYQGAEEGFAEKYLDMLRAGGSKRHGELLAPFGLDAADPAFWRRGLSVIEGMIDELERLE
ncbi:oligoendopeptidase F [Stella humosa]|uniref:Oligoendopeptidase F n=1 Tax=Stella humosa TaxID=94 RepID=A0A3N1KWZ3_9PROT|nr:M3 family oligoendopeptidase [Stella humosa]ROP83120.1 oligoendopeptidase F [Stella humosa]BBK30103.1 oligoendopeptidase F [Stella humosa]